MTNRPICPKGQRKTGSPCIFCENGSYCAHQYYCPATRRYENTRWRECRKLKFIQESEQEVNKEVKSVKLPVQEVKKSEEVKQIGAKKVNRRKPRKG